MSDTPLLACVIAIELDSDAVMARRRLSPGDAGQLAAHVMADLAERLPQIERCGLALSGALYDATEILQPGWPLFHHLQNHYQRAVKGLPQLLALGEREGRMPDPQLEPDPRRAGSALAFLPFVLAAPEDIAVDLRQALEELLVASGQLGAASALGLQTLFGLRLQHAQFMTRYDVCALMAAQLDPLGLAPLWSLLETGLFTPDGESAVEDAQGGRWYWRAGRVESGFSGYHDWLAGEAGQMAIAEGRVEQAFVDALLTQRQYLSLLHAHGVDVWWPGARREAMVEVLASGKADAVRAVRIPQLGLAALFATRGATIVGISYPFGKDGFAEIAADLEHLTDGEDLQRWPADPVSGRLALI